MCYNMVTNSHYPTFPLGVIQMKPYIRLYSILLILSILLSACTISDQPEPTVAATFPITQAPTDPPVTQPPVTEPPITEPPVTEPPPTEPPETVVPIDFPSGAHMMTYASGKTRDYLEYFFFIPEDATTNLPLVVFLHGDGEVDKPGLLVDYGIVEKMYERYGGVFPFVVVSPCTRVTSWTLGYVSGTLKGLIDHLVEKFGADPDRIIITGHSRGAMGVWYMINTYPGFFAGAIPISCGANTPIDDDICAKIPILGFVGTEGDYENRYRNAMDRIIEDINHAGGNAERIMLEGARHEDTPYDAFTEDTFRWILERRRGE